MSLLCFSVQIKQTLQKNINSVLQQRGHHHQKVLIESFHLNGHTFRFRCTVQDLEVFLFQRNSSLAVKRLKEYRLMVAFNLFLTMAVKILVHKPLSQSCAAKSDKFWQATGQSNLPDKMEDCSIGHWTIKLARQNGRLLHWPKSSCLSTKTKL